MRLIALFMVAAPLTAFAEQGNVQLFAKNADLGRGLSPFVAIDVLDSEARSRFHLSSRFSFDDGDKAFTKTTRWTYELFTAVRLTQGIALTGTLPFGLDAPSPGANTFFVGNFRVGIAGGFGIPLTNHGTNVLGAPRLRIALGFDVYAPTAPQIERKALELLRDSISVVRAIRSYDPALYLERTMSFRSRVQADFRVSVLATQLEVGLAPAFTAERDSRFLMLFHWLFRLAVQPTDAIEPYLELGNTLHVAGKETLFDLTLPVHLNLGLRVHVGSVSPAFFATLDLDGGTLMFGLDIAGVVAGIARDDEVEDDIIDF